MNRSPTILITCGETSGDLHAANLVKELKRRLPDARILALGGERLRQAGAEILHHIDDYAVIGVSAVLTNLPKFVRLERSLKKTLAAGVDLFIPVDYPGMNLRLAEYAKKFEIPVLYYISPQVWAWGEGRVDRVARSVDYMAVILPFEEAIYKDRGIPAEFVGHPLVEDHPLPPPGPHDDRSGIGLLPGSRPSEVRRILPLLLDTAERIKQERPDERFTVACSPSVPERIYRRLIARHSLDADLTTDTHGVMKRSSLLLVASGTATLEGALFETPLIVVYRMSLFNYAIARRIVKLDNVGLVNIILGDEICPEFIQAEADPKSIADRALSILEDPSKREAMVARFSTLRSLLSGAGGCRRVAEISEQLLNS
jgi:lipid-A-disaccharide synthase